MAKSLVEEEVYKMTPQELTSLLYEHMIDRLEQAIHAIAAKDFENANNHLKKCNDLLYRLGAGINYEAGIIADQLEAIYNYMADRLIEANMKKDKQIVQEVLNLIRIISDSWNIALKKGANSSQNTLSLKTQAYERDYI